MAASVVSTTVDHTAHVGKWQLVIGTLSVGAGDYATGGLTVDFSNLKIKSSKVPVFCLVSGVSGFVYSYVPGSTKNAGKLKVMYCDYDANTDGALIELPASAVPNGVKNDSITFFALFPIMR